MPRKLRTILIHGGLFLLSLITTMMVGAELVEKKYWFTWGLLDPELDPANYVFQLKDLWKGLPYSLAFLGFLTVHEFGHYFTAMYHRVRSSLPYYIPIYIPIPGVLNIGSFGAVIRLKETPRSTREYFDIGIAGPLAGFVVSLLLLVYGFTTLPPMECPNRCACIMACRSMKASRSSASPLRVSASSRPSITATTRP